MEIEPNTKVFVEEFGREDLNSLDRVSVQLMAYKRDKTFMLKAPVDVQLRIDSVKFYKLHTFQPNDFFEQPALVYTLIENDHPARPIAIDPQKLKQNMYGAGNIDAADTAVSASGAPERRQPVTVEKGAGGETLAIVDLHASALLETTAGMGPSDILNYQLDTMRRVLKQYEKQKGTKVILIHGKGEGVLRKAIINELQYRYKSYPRQDASFREYGYGATQVTIR